MTRSAYDTPGVKSVTAWALTHDGHHAGNLVLYRAPTSGGVTATLSIWSGPLAVVRALHGRAGGGGYDKASAAVYHAAHQAPAGHRLHEAMDATEGRGMGEVRRRLEGAGYTVCTVS